MIALKPSLVIQSPPLPSNYVQAARPESRPTSSYSHASFFHSLLLDMQIYSPSVKLVKLSGQQSPQPYPVFCDEDKIHGKVVLDPSCSQNGRLTISLEGAFEYSSGDDSPGPEYFHSPTDRKPRHVFLSSSATVPMLPIPDSRQTIREALSIRKRPSTSSLNAPALRYCEFSFDLPRGSRAGEQMPPTFSSEISPGDLRRRSRVEELQIAYRITAVWETSDGSEPKAILEVPVIFQPDTDFHSFDGFTMEPKSWLEIPLIPERPLPFNCAVTLPSPKSFSRCSSIPYFVVFATTAAGSQSLVKEIAADATIAVSLIRKVTITPQRKPQSPTPPDTPPASDDSDSPITPFPPRTRLLKRSIRTLTRSFSQDESISTQKPLPELPQEDFSMSRTLETQVLIGFPKRARVNDGLQNLPDGLCKGKVQLSKDMLPSVDWPSISIKYYLDVSVLFGQDDVRARIAINIY